MKRQLYENKRVRKLFLKEKFTETELDETLGVGLSIESRQMESLKYAFIDGQISAIETRIAVSQIHTKERQICKNKE